MSKVHSHRAMARWAIWVGSCWTSPAWAWVPCPGPAFARLAGTSHCRARAARRHPVRPDLTGSPWGPLMRRSGAMASRCDSGSPTRSRRTERGSRPMSGSPMIRPGPGSMKRQDRASVSRSNGEPSCTARTGDTLSIPARPWTSRRHQGRASISAPRGRWWRAGDRLAGRRPARCADREQVTLGQLAMQRVVRPVVCSRALRSSVDHAVERHWQPIPPALS